MSAASAVSAATPAEHELLSVEVLATLVGGVAEYVQSGSEGLDLLPRGTTRPEPPDQSLTQGVINVAADARIRASSALSSNPASFAIDGTREHWNAAGMPRQWIELALARPIELVEVRLGATSR